MKGAQLRLHAGIVHLAGLVKTGRYGEGDNIVFSKILEDVEDLLDEELKKKLDAINSAGYEIKEVD